MLLKVRKRMAKGVICIASVAAALVTATTASAAGAVNNISYLGWVGPYNPGLATCRSAVGLVGIQLPQVAAVNANSGPESQWVRFRAFLYRVDPATGIAVLTADSTGDSMYEQWAYAHDYDNNGIGAAWNTNYSILYFAPRYQGTYRIVTQVDWLTSPTVPYAGRTVALMNTAFGGPDCRL